MTTEKRETGHTPGRRSIKDRSFAQWPEDAAHGGTQGREALNQRIYMQYLGVLSLLGRVVSQADLSDMDREPIDHAFADANVVLRRIGSMMYFERCSGGGYAAFEDRGAKATGRYE